MSLATLREGTEADAIDGIVPRHVARPESAEDLARTLAEASRGRQFTVLRGGGSKLGWGRIPARVDLVVETSGLDRLVAHRFGDMTATAQAGMPLASLNRLLAEHGQHLPVDTAFDEATVGGILATNDAGPSRHKYGTPRDLLIGVTLALTDGRLVKAGGTVVKNVAGYDLGKLVTGSHGSLVAIVDATFKLLPIPRASATLVAAYTSIEKLVHDISALNASQVEMEAFDLRASDEGIFHLLLRMASGPRATEAQVREARALLSTDASTVTSDDERSLWRDQIRMPWASGAATVRFSWLPTNLSRMLELMAGLQRHGCRPAVLTGRALGAGLLCVDGAPSACVAAIEELRAQTDAVGHVAVLRAAPDIKERLDVWGPASPSAALAHSLKRMFDPAGILNAGRGPI